LTKISIFEGIFINFGKDFQFFQELKLQQKLQVEHRAASFQ